MTKSLPLYDTKRDGDPVTRRHHAFCATPHGFFLECPKYFPGTEYLVLGAIMSRTIGQSKSWAKITKFKLAMWTGKSERQIQRALSSLLAKKVIEVRHHEGGRGVEPHYALDFSAIQGYVLAAQKGDIHVAKRETSVSPRIKDLNSRQNLPKRITAAPTAKTAVVPPGEREGAGESLAQKQKADAPSGWSTTATVLAPAIRQQKPIPGMPEPETLPPATHLAVLRDKLKAYMEGDEPPEGFERRCWLAGRGNASVADICELIDRKWSRKRLRPDGKCGPERWNWFLAVIRNEFVPGERSRRPRGITPAVDVPVNTDSLARPFFI